MEQTNSYRQVFPQAILERYEFAEVRNAATTLSGTSAEEFSHIVKVMSEFRLNLASLTDPGGSKGEIARYLDLEFRKLGWREAKHSSETTFTLRLSPYREAGETRPVERTQKFMSEGHMVDNVRSRVALDVEWNAKDGNLDRDLANFRALHDAAVIDAGVIITRHHERTKWAANYLAAASNRVRYDNRGHRIVLLGTTTTTTMEKLIPRLERGDGGGCPVLVIAITEKCYGPQPGDPELPPYGGPVALEGVPEEPTEPSEL